MKTATKRINIEKYITNIDNYIFVFVQHIYYILICTITPPPIPEITQRTKITHKHTYRNVIININTVCKKSAQICLISCQCVSGGYFKRIHVWVCVRVYYTNHPLILPSSSFICLSTLHNAHAFIFANCKEQRIAHVSVFLFRTRRPICQDQGHN